MEQFLSGFAVILHWHYIAYMCGGVFFGLILGFLPGLHGGVGLALMLPFSFELDPLSSLVFLLSIYTGSLFGGAVTSILFNTPGTTGNLATTFDGYQMTLNGEAGRALGLSLMSSFLGGTIGCLCLLLVAKPMAHISLRFGPGEMFMVAVFGLSVIGSLSSNILKSLYSGLFGLLLGTIGTNASGVIRGTMKSLYLMDGLPIAPALMGLIALPEVYFQMANVFKFDRVNMSAKNLFVQFVKGQFETFRHFLQVILCSLLGVFVGIMPAAGSAVASMLSYNQTKQFSRNSEKFGTGIAQGIIASETANNASEGGSLATMFVLGIPGSGATAIMLGALILQGWMPGPGLFAQHSEVIYCAFSSLFVQQFVMLIMGGVLCLLGTQIIRLPFVYLMPCIVIFMVLGAYSGRYLLFDPAIMLMFSVLGWLMKKNDFPTAPLLLGLLLGPIADVELARIYQAFDYFWEIFQSPIVCLLAMVSVLGIFYPVVLNYKKQRKA